MMQLANAMRAHAAMAMQERAAPRLAKVTSYDPVNYCVKVTLQPEGTETGWIPVLSPWIGNGWGLFCPPTPGDMVEIQFQEDSINAGFACLRFFTDANRPLTVQSGEFWLVHKAGAFFKFTNDGKALINSAVEIDATAPVINITATASVTIQAPSIILKNAGSALKKLCTDLFMTLYNGHTHTSAAAGSQTSSPTQQATLGTHTTNIVQAE